MRHCYYWMLEDKEEGVPGADFGKWHEPCAIMWSILDRNRRFILTK